MRLPWLQIDADGMTRGEMLGRLLGIGPDAGIGLALRLWRWALEMSPEGDFSGGAHDPRNVAAGVGWSPDEAEKLCGELVLTGLAEMPVGAGFARIRGLERYRRAWEKNKRRKPALVVPVTGKNPAGTGAEPARKTETETEKKETMSATADGSVERIFEKYKTAAQSPRSKLDDKRRRLIRQRLEHFTEEDLCRALDGYAHSPHHHGQNDRNTRYVTLELWFRDTAHVEAGMAMAAGPPLPPVAIAKTTLDPYPEHFR